MKNKQKSPGLVPDIKYLNIPNICFSLLSKGDDREIEYSKQRIQRGFDDSETWSLTDTICRFILPRLSRFKECSQGIPHGLNQDDWYLILDKMILTFNLICRDNGIRIWSEHESKQIDEGLNLFKERFLALWW